MHDPICLLKIQLFFFPFSTPSKWWAYFFEEKLCSNQFSENKFVCAKKKKKSKKMCFLFYQIFRLIAQ